MAYIIVLIATFLLLINFKRGMLLLAPLKIVVLNSVSISGISINAIITFIAACCFLNYRNKLIRKGKFPLTLPFVLMVVLNFIGMFQDEFYLKLTFFYLFDTYTFTYLLFLCIESYNDIILIIKSLSVAIGIVLINALVEMLSGQSINVLSDFIQNNSYEGLYFSTDDYEALGRGVRIRSGYSHSIVFGDICALFLYLYLFLYITIGKKTKYIVYILTLAFGILISSSRTPILGLLAFIIPIFRTGNIISKQGLVLISIMLLGFYFTHDYIYEVIDSLFNQNTVSKIQGSSMELRLEQLEGCFMVISNNLLFGLGRTFNLDDWSWLLAGNESIWFELLCYHGIIGCVVYVLIYYKIIKNSLYNKYFVFILFLSIGWLLMCTASNLSNMDSYPLFLAFIIIYKLGKYQNIQSLAPHVCKRPKV